MTRVAKLRQQAQRHSGLAIMAVLLAMSFYLSEAQHSIAPHDTRCSLPFFEERVSLWLELDAKSVKGAWLAGVAKNGGQNATQPGGVEATTGMFRARKPPVPNCGDLPQLLPPPLYFPLSTLDSLAAAGRQPGVAPRSAADPGLKYLTPLA